MKLQESEASRWDWFPILVGLLIVLLMAIAVFELWIPHGSVPTSSNEWSAEQANTVATVEEE